VTRIERLELAVQHLSERVLGEGVRFEEIAEQEAQEQGVAYTPPPAAPDLEPLLERVAALEQRPIPVPPEFPAIPPAYDDAPLRAEIEALRGALAAADRRHVEQERALQTVIQAADGLLSRLSVIESAMAALADAAEKRLNAA
jgi:uncharacterized membrane protein YccC